MMVAVAVQVFTGIACARMSQTFPTKHMGMYPLLFLLLFGSHHCIILTRAM